MQNSLFNNAITHALPKKITGAFSVVIAASLSAILTPVLASSAIAQSLQAAPSTADQSAQVQRSQTVLAQSNTLPTLTPPRSSVTRSSERAAEALPTPIFIEDNSFQLISPSIDVYNVNTNAPVVVVDPVEQSYLNQWERTLTTQNADVNIRSAVQAPITQIRIRAGRPVIRRFGEFTTDSVFSTSGAFSTLSNFSTSSGGTRTNFYAYPSTQNQITAFSDLPDGNYRVLLPSGRLQDNTVRDGRLFTFRKSGDRVTGNFDYVGTGDRACVTGTLQGNTVFGEAITSSPGVQVLDRTYLGSGLSLQLSESSSAVLSLNGFSLINAGTVAPPTTCR